MMRRFRSIANKYYGFKVQCDKLAPGFLHILMIQHYPVNKFVLRKYPADVASFG
ncbi:hypothetical protein CANARDRAFT_27053 [[Candida] arabinofermentans NRRL YB-2248]|uniref:Uncharacterized protein n=1 Tax=[Candida] arabinofermentans NRRL YB-2248 TaxID=983967 RepID=A0A1E4T4D6_9ASCO|nr:hypothetical protein CANARDRAFT_27053 [[Candida] arabinofermentans NRRL YB-2248]